VDATKLSATTVRKIADDVIVHCRTEKQAQEVRAAIARRMQECRLELHTEKTKLVYCKDDDRRERYAQEQFDFLGYTFRSRSSKGRTKKYFINFSPAISEKASKAIRREIRDWKLHMRSETSGLYPLRQYLNRVLARWATRKYKKLRHRFRRAEQWLRRVSQRDSRLFTHWQLRAQSGSAMGAV
jgi:RNA-directed DNA polymerase